MALRCPWCAQRVDDADEFCGACTAVVVPASAWPVARMLRDAGVDRLALPERVRTLDEPTRRRLERTFDEQAAVVRARLAEAAVLAKHLREPGIVDVVGDALWPLLPLPPPQRTALGLPDQRPLASDGEIALLLVDDEPVPALRALAAVVLFARGDRSGTVRVAVEDAVFRGDAIAREAAVLLAPPSTAPWRSTDGRWRRALEAALLDATHSPVLGDEATLSLTTSFPERRAAHGRTLRRIAGDHRQPYTHRVLAVAALDDVDAAFGLLADLDVEEDAGRFGDDRAALVRFLCRRDDVDALLPRLPRADRPLAAHTLRRAPIEVRRTLQDWLRDDDVDDGTITAIVALYRRAAIDVFDDDDRAAFAAVVDRLDLEALLQLVPTWTGHAFASDDDASARLLRRIGEAIAGDVHAASDHRLFGTLVDHVAGARRAVDDADLVFGAVLRHAKPTARLLDRVCGRLTRDDDGAALLLALWTAALRLGVDTTAWADATRRWSPHAASVAVLWQRFVDHVDERAAIVAAFPSYRRALRERRDALPAEQRPGGGTAAGHLAVWLDVDDEVLTVLDDAWALLAAGADADDDLAAASALAMHHADALLRRGQFRLALVVGFRVGCRIEQCVDARSRDDDVLELSPSLQRAEDGWRAAVDALIAAAADRRGRDDVDNAWHFVDDIAVRRRLLDEHHARLERRRPEPEPEPEPATTTTTTTTTTTAAPPRITLPMPAFSPTGLDREVFDALPLPTLLSYAQVLKAMQHGHDVMAVFAAAGLDVPAWVAAANRWGERLRHRPALAWRFGELLQLPWT